MEYGSQEMRQEFAVFNYVIYYETFMENGIYVTSSTERPVEVNFSKLRYELFLLAKYPGFFKILNDYLKN